MKAATFAFALLLLFSTVPLCAEQAGPPVNIYALALTEAAKEMDRQWAEFSISSEVLLNRIPTDYKHLIVAKDASVQSAYPSVSGQTTFEFLTSREIHARRRKLRKDFTFLTVYPATVEGARVKVVVAQDWATIMKRKPVIAISDWALIYFRINAETGQFCLDEVKLGGI